MDSNHSGGLEGSGNDTVHYSVSVDGHTGPYTIEVRLLFQALRPSFVNSMHADADRVRIQIESDKPYLKFSEHKRLYKPKTDYREDKERSKNKREANKRWFQEYQKNKMNKKETKGCDAAWSTLIN